MNKPVAWVTQKALDDLRIPLISEITLRIAVKSKRTDPFNIPLYTQDQFEEARKLGMQQERAMWELSDEDKLAFTKEYFNIHPETHLSEQFKIKLYELIDFARAILKKASKK